MTILDQWKALAEIENKRMRERSGSPNFGAHGTTNRRLCPVVAKRRKKHAALREDGWSIRQISDFTGHSICTVHNDIGHGRSKVNA